jgi:hypothetical protein
MGGKMGRIGMKLAPEVLNELSHGTFYVGDKRIPAARHIASKIISWFVARDGG